MIQLGELCKPKAYSGSFARSRVSAVTSGGRNSLCRFFGLDVSFGTQKHQPTAVSVLSELFLTVTRLKSSAVGEKWFSGSTSRTEFFGNTMRYAAARFDLPNCTDESFVQQGFGHRKRRPKPSTVLFLAQVIQKRVLALKRLTNLVPSWCLCVHTVEGLSLPLLHDGHLLCVTRE